MVQQTNDQERLSHIVSEAGMLIAQGRLDESEQLLGALPDSLARQPAIRAQLAVIASQRGRLDDAETEFRSLLKTYPRADLACNLGLVLIQKNQDAQALEIFRSALGMPSCPSVAHKHAGRLLLRSNQPMQALEHFRALEKSQPPNHENLTDIGFALLANDQPLEAEPPFRNALSMSDRSGPAWHGLAQSLQYQNRLDEAIDAYGKAIELSENPLQIEVDLAILYETSNRAAEAKQLAEKILQRHPNQPHAMLVSARCLRRGGRPDQASTVLKSLLDTDAASLQQRSSSHHLLGRIEDEAGNSDMAFSHFEKGNHVAAQLAGADGISDNPYIVHADQVRCWATPETLSEIATSSAPDARQPVFLIGFPRSGTTLLDQLLDAHPGIQVMEEKPAVTAMQRHFRTQHSYPEDIAAMSDADIASLRSVYFDLVDRHIERRDDALLIDKLPLNIVAIPFIHRVFPGARFIVALRHPCDVCLSCFMQEFGPNVATLNFFSLEQIASLYASVMALWQTVSGLPLNVHTQRYEDLVDDLEGQARALTEFLGIEFDPAVLQFQQHARQRGSINTPSYDQVSRPLYRDARFRWTRYRHHLEPVMPTLTPFIDAFGYRSR